jgi:nucleotide-binding universal stress UspA family protein
MYSNLLVPLDGSQLSEAILPFARSLASASKIPVELLQVIDPDTIVVSADPPIGRFFDTVEADLKRASSDYLKSVAGSFPDSLTVQRSVEIGKPAEVIVDRAASHRGTLIAMSTHGRSGIERWFLGSVADKVLHASANPLLLVRATAKNKTGDVAALKTILVPLDGSPLAELVLPHVAEVAKAMKLVVVLLRVYSVPVQAYAGEGFVPDYTQVTESIREEAKSYLEGKVEQLKGEGLDRVSYVMLGGEAAGEVIDMARDTPDSLMAMCTHGRSGVGRWVLGSVTDRVVRHGGDPVLVIRSEQT